MRRPPMQGLANAQFNLGFKNANGEGVPKDRRRSLTLVPLAAKQGDASAQFNLGFMYAGEGILGRMLEAGRWFSRR